jgi:hypothetical protein
MDDELVEVEPHPNHFSTATASVHVWIYWALLPFPYRSLPVPCMEQLELNNSNFSKAASICLKLATTDGFYFQKLAPGVADLCH